MKKIITSSLLGLILVGCGGGGGAGGVSTSNLSSSGSAEFPTQQIIVTVIDETNDPSIAPTLSQAITYIQQQFQVDIDPAYNSNVSVVAGTDTSGLTVHLRKQGAYTINGGEQVNSYYDLNHDGYVAINSNTSTNWPAYLDHIVENMCLYPSRHLLIGQKYEAIDYSPVDHTQTRVSGFYWLCDWEKSDGKDYLGTSK